MDATGHTYELSLLSEQMTNANVTAEQHSKYSNRIFLSFFTFFGRNVGQRKKF